MIETVVALLMFVNGEIKEHLVQENMAACLRGKRHAEREFSGALLRPHGPALRPMMEQGAPVSDILEAAREAGQQLIEKQGMAVETLDRVSRVLLPLEAYVR